MSIFEDVIYPSVDEVNELIEEDKIPKEKLAVLFGQNTTLDSLNLVKFILTVEEKIEEKYDISVTLANEKAIDPAFDGCILLRL